MPSMIIVSPARVSSITSVVIVSLVPHFAIEMYSPFCLIDTKKLLTHVFVNEKLLARRQFLALELTPSA